MRAMGLDLGTKTIGVAVADELGLTAQGVTTLARKGKRGDLSTLLALARERAVDRFVLGLPLNMDGSEGPRAQATRAFGDALATASQLPVLYQDE
ncbi:MAG: Holliday junction resolvase RuvX, partial [Deltaproteobacteria bacterium]|nr:Holliday junction resolvase RuvX [Deltaproteobacteria bacterium]